MNEHSIEYASSNFLAKSNNFFCQLCSSHLKPFLFSNATEKDGYRGDPPNLIDENDDDYSALLINNLPHCSIGNRIAYSRDGVNKDGELINIVLDPNRTKLLHVLRFKDHSVL